MFFERGRKLEKPIENLHRQTKERKALGPFHCEAAALNHCRHLVSSESLIEMHFFVAHKQVVVSHSIKIWKEEIDSRQALQE